MTSPTESLEGLVEVLADPTVVVDASGTVTQANSSAEALLGWGRGSRQGSPWRCSFPRDCAWPTSATGASTPRLRNPAPWLGRLRYWNRNVDRLELENLYPQPEVRHSPGGPLDPDAIKSDAVGWWCDPFWGCYVVGDAQYANQWQVGGGVTLRF